MLNLPAHNKLLLRHYQPYQASSMMITTAHSGGSHVKSETFLESFLPAGEQRHVRRRRQQPLAAATGRSHWQEPLAAATGSKPLAVSRCDAILFSFHCLFLRKEQINNSSWVMKFPLVLLHGWNFFRRREG